MTVLTITLATGALSQAGPSEPIAMDLHLIGHVAAKGRVQDKTFNPTVPIVDALIQSGPAAIPFLVSKLEDDTEIDGPVLDYWPRVHVGDVALLLLCDFFSRPDRKRSTVPGMSWDTILERRNADVPAWTLLDDFLTKYGRVGLRRKIEAMLKPHHGRFAWDEKERCFKPDK